MQFIIAPAKKMRVDVDTFAPTSLPQSLPQTTEILATLRSLSPAQRQKLWQCSDKLAQACEQQLAQLNLTGPLTPAILAFVGIQYQSMAPDLFTESALQYIQAHLRILSGFYGTLRPFDGIVPYRLELGSKLSVKSAKDLYAYWGAQLYEQLDLEDGPLINLASVEYAKAIRPYLRPSDTMIDVVFGRVIAGTFKTRATQAKIARGAMVRFAAMHDLTQPDQLKAFDHPHYAYAPARSTPTQMVFEYHD
ncbi:peroxide stress protein YaaA [Lacticaseibacillus sp. N501-2]|uniref:peroxide stress protein YaaA n=1 Tax=Lacticaseibacillus salsurae TaxID=3367729 RepID=UPI0038B341A8